MKTNTWIYPPELPPFLKVSTSAYRISTSVDVLIECDLGFRFGYYSFDNKRWVVGQTIRDSVTRFMILE